MKYEFICLPGFYINSEYSTWALFYWLLRRGRGLGLSRPAERQVYAWLPKRLIHFARVSKLCAEYFCLQRGWRTGAEAARYFPVDGTIAFPRSSGRAKIFDLPGKRVITIYAGQEEIQLIQSRRELLNRLSAARLAPTLYALDIQTATSSEEYINGERAPMLLEGEPNFSRYFLPVIEGLRQVMACERIAAGEYAKRVCADIDIHQDFLRELDVAIPVMDFVHTIMDKLARYPDPEVELAVSHGDLTEKNLLCDSGRHGEMRAVDWESAATRTLLYDTYSVFFSALVRISRNDEPELPAVFGQMHEAALKVLDISSGHALQQEPGDGMPEVYRYLYYLECTVMRLNTFVVPVASRSKDLAMTRFSQLLEYLDMFRKCDRYFNRTTKTQTSDPDI